MTTRSTGLEGQYGVWGLLPNVLAPGSQKYDGLISTIHRQVMPTSTGSSTMPISRPWRPTTVIRIPTGSRETSMTTER